jgi:hypothetical protein
MLAFRYSRQRQPRPWGHGERPDSPLTVEKEPRQVVEQPGRDGQRDPLAPRTVGFDAHEAERRLNFVGSASQDRSVEHSQVLREKEVVAIPFGRDHDAVGPFPANVDRRIDPDDADENLEECGHAPARQLERLVIEVVVDAADADGARDEDHVTVAARRLQRLVDHRCAFSGQGARPPPVTNLLADLDA